MIGRFAEFGMTCHVVVYILFTMNDVILGWVSSLKMFFKDELRI